MAEGFAVELVIDGEAALATEDGQPLCALRNRRLDDAECAD